MKKFLKQKQTGIGLVLLGGLVLASVILTARNSVEIRGLASLVPSEKTAIFVEIDLRENPNDYGIWKNLWGLWGEDSDTSILFEDGISPWWNKHAGIVLINSGKEKLEPLYILETENPEQSKKILEEHAKTFLQNFFSSQNYFFFSPDKKTLDEIKIFLENPQETLARDPDFFEIFGSLPAAFMVKFYAKPSLLPEAVSPFFESYRSLGGTIQILPDKGPFVSGMMLASNRLFTGSKKRYEAKLLKYFPGEPEFFFAGERIQNEKAFGKFSDEFLNFLQNSDILPENEILKFFEQEYALALYPDTKKGNDFLVVTGYDGQTSQLKTFVSLALAYIAPEIRPVTLGDGTKAQEYFANPENIVPHEESIEGKSVTVFETKNREWEVYLAHFGETLFLGSNREIFASSLKGNNVFQDTAAYPVFSEVLRGVQETLFVQSSFLGKKVILPSFANAFSSFALSTSDSENGLKFYLFAKEKET